MIECSNSLGVNRERAIRQFLLEHAQIGWNPVDWLC